MLEQFSFCLTFMQELTFSPLCIHIFFHNCLTTATHSLKRLVHAFSSLILAKEMEMERISETGVLGWTLLSWHQVRCHLVCTGHAYIKDYDFSYGGIGNRPNPMHRHHLQKFLSTTILCLNQVSVNQKLKDYNIKILWQKYVNSINWALYNPCLD